VEYGLVGLGIMPTDNVHLDIVKDGNALQLLQLAEIVIGIENVEFIIDAVMITNVQRVFHHVLTKQPIMNVPTLMFALNIEPVILIIALKNQVKNVFVVDYLELHVP
jgi:hypothetical protein